MNTIANKIRWDGIRWERKGDCGKGRETKRDHGRERERKGDEAR